jgi:GT2 family glycosyltransferase
VPTPVLSIATGTRNRPESINRFVDSVLQKTRVPFELLVADASDRSREFRCADHRVLVRREDPPLGPVRGFNALFRLARGRLVCFLNDDLEVTPGWDKAVLWAATRFWRADLLCLPVLERGEQSPKILLYCGLPFACMGVVRRKAGEAMGWWDEGYAFYAVDPDFAMRVITTGRRLAPVLGTCVVHNRLADEERASHRELLERDNARLDGLWRPQLAELYRRYRCTSYRYFRGLDTVFSEVWQTDALEVPLAGTPTRRPRRPHRVDTPDLHWNPPS